MSLLTLVAGLREADNDAVKQELSAAVGSEIISAPAKFDRFIHPLVTSKLPAAVGLEFLAIVKGSFFQRRLDIYEDSSGQVKVSLGLTYLQDYSSSDADLDSRVLDALEELIEADGLDILINDISVNFLQSRNGERFDIMSYGA